MFAAVLTSIYFHSEITRKHHGTRVLIVDWVRQTNAVVQHLSTSLQVKEVVYLVRNEARLKMEVKGWKRDSLLSTSL